MGRIKLAKKLISKVGGAGRRLLGSKAVRGVRTAGAVRTGGKLLKRVAPIAKKVSKMALRTVGRAGVAGALGVGTLAVGGVALARRGIKKLKERRAEGQARSSRRSAVPKVVTKYFTKLERKEKKINKILSTIVNKTTAGKLMKQRLKKTGGSAGIITRDEALSALRK